MLVQLVESFFILKMDVVSGMRSYLADAASKDTSSARHMGDYSNVHCTNPKVVVKVGEGEMSDVLMLGGFQSEFGTEDEDKSGPALVWEEAAEAPVARLDGAAVQIGHLFFVFAGYATIDEVVPRLRAL